MIRKIFLYFQVLLYVTAGCNHFIHPDFYLNILPKYLPYPSFLVVLSGIIEIVLGILLIPVSTRKIAAWFIALMLFAFLPVHMYMLQQSIEIDHYQTTIPIAIARLLLQPVLIFLMLWSVGIILKPISKKQVM